ncbi:BSP-domain-containing protein [Daldinia caldariorum]|uniref:BSP-domain-containing protein n=1 Tax=Daldinia caldariorum TaxID=326644 RepID=UPI0020074ACD|nr:BSP-domain-containing protein [Daldinia caldariorum]KAI1470220.1 BSP-domain-containing protein [Daldinia caldariorum]
MSPFNSNDTGSVSVSVSVSETATLYIHLTMSQSEKEEAVAAAPLSVPFPPETTPAPQPVFLPGMSHAAETPTPSPVPAPAPSAIPIRPKADTDTETAADNSSSSSSSPSASTVDLPRLRLHIQDVAHPGSSVFLSSVNAATVLRDSIDAIHTHLYTDPLSSSTSSSSLSPPPTRSVTLILRDMDGVAYTTGVDLDPEHHKEIHFSLRYISSVAPPSSSRQSAEIRGVLLHELVHCYQWNGRGRAPGGLIEGVADWVRLRCDLAPPHWRRDQVPAKWDVGYQGTAYFLEYLEKRFGEGIVRRLNEKLREEAYDEKTFWTELVGGSVEQLFEDYKKTLVKGA